MRLFDSHLHLTDQAFADDRAAVLQRAGEAGVEGMVTVATHPEDAHAALALARVTRGMWCTAGLHPHEAERFGPDTVSTIESLTREPEVVAVGEMGLDFYYDNAPKARQQEAFEAQLELAASTGLPAVVHSREADAQTAAHIQAFKGRARGVLHCFTGGMDLLETALDADWYVSFSGIVSFKAFAAAETVRRVPDDRLLIETDSPYLAPVPNRGRRNEPAFVALTCNVVADIRQGSAEDVASLTLRNAREFYSLTQG
ncbi:MAG: TatD family hydrolase [Gemmatimonadota bacterium]